MAPIGLAEMGTQEVLLGADAGHDRHDRETSGGKR
jgi:hypothetical protein